MGRVFATLVVAALCVAATANAAVSFTDVAGQVGIDNGALAQGCFWGDEDGDGYPDLYLTNNQILIIGAPNRLYRYDPIAGRFNDVAPSLTVDDDGTAFGAAWGDYDNDGRLDLFLVRGVISLLREPHLLFHNEGPATPWSRRNGGTPELPVPSGSGRSTAWADYDNDGHLDLVVTKGLNSCPPFLPCPQEPPTLLRNRGDGTFEDRTGTAGLRNMLNSHGVAWGDYDNDGWPDLFVVNHGFPDANIFESNVLYHNRRDGTFEDVTATYGVAGDEDGNNRGCFGAAWGDYNNDGFLDLYVSCGFDTVGAITGFSATNLLYQNQGGTGFRDVSLSSLTADPESSFGCAWGDYDNDGLLDVYVANGRALPPATPTNRLFRNTGFLGVFTDTAGSVGVDSDAFSQGTAWADFDRDGDLDLYVVETETTDKLYRSSGATGTWLELTLVGTDSNRAGIGARVTARSGSPSRLQTRQVQGGSGYLSQDDLTLHFGLGSANDAEVEIHWPGPTFCVQNLGRVAANQHLRVVEDCSPAYNVLRAPWSQPLGAVFPLPVYQPLPAVGPFLDPEPVLGGPDPLLLYQIDLPASVLRMRKQGNSVALEY